MSRSRMRRFVDRLFAPGNRPWRRERPLSLEWLESRDQPANLQITSISACDESGNAIATPAVGQLVYLKAEFKAIDLPLSAKYQIRFSVDGQTKSTDQLTWGAGTAGVSNWVAVWGNWAVKAGNHTIKAELDWTNTVVESTNADNVKSATLVPTTFKSAYVTNQKFVTPLAGTAFQNWTIVNYNDMDTGSGVLDYKGKSRSYNGHDALDITLSGAGTANRFYAMDFGVPVIAAADGVVVSVVDNNFDRNSVWCADIPDGEPHPDANFITIDHGNGWRTSYLHNRQASAAVQVGDYVRAGDQIALIGSSGCSTDPHLHFSVRYNGAIVETYYAPSSYWVSPLPYAGDAPQNGAVLFPAAITNVSETAGLAKIMVTRTNADDPLVVNWTTQGMTATAGNDYQASSGTVVFPEDVRFAYVTVPMTNDDIHEDGEKFRINLTPVGGGASWFTEVNIIDDDRLFHYDRDTDTFTINGNTENLSDTITLDVEGANIVADVNGRTISFPVSGPAGPVSNIVVRSGDGSDKINVRATPLGVAVRVDAGTGTDLITVGAPGVLFGATYTLDTIKGSLTIDGGAGQNTLNLMDNPALAVARNYTVTDAKVTRTGVTVNYDNVQAVNLTAGDAADTVTILSAGVNSPVKFDGGGGSDTVIGPNASTTWIIEGLNKGFLMAGNANFVNCESLSGGSLGNTYKFLAAGSLTGNLSGGSGLADKVDYSSYGKQVVTNLQTSKSTAIGGIMSSIEHAVGSALTTDQLIGANQANSWLINGANIVHINGAFQGTGFENLKGGSVADTFTPLAGMAVGGTVDGGGGTDRLNYASHVGAVTVDFASKKAPGMNAFAGIEAVTGSTGVDTIFAPGTTGVNAWSLTGANQGTIVNGTTAISFDGIENLKGAPIADVFSFQPGGSVAGTVDGQGGTDALSYASRTSAVSVNLASKTASAVGSFANIESFQGGSAIDTFTGPNLSNSWKLSGKNSGTIATTTFSNFENLGGGTGSDFFAVLAAGSLTGNLAGGPGADTLDYAAFSVGVTVDLAAGTATSIGGGISGIENVNGGSAHDQLTGDEFTNILRGAGGGDELDGAGGNDIVLGGLGNDTLLGGLGRDFVFGGAGGDRIHGGDEDDIVVGSATAHDDKNNVLLDMLAVWTSLLTYSNRIDALRNTGVLHGSAKLDAAAIVDDGAKDTILGALDSDWFWAHGSGLTRDTTDRAAGEQLN